MLFRSGTLVDSGYYGIIPVGHGVRRLCSTHNVIPRCSCTVRSCGAENTSGSGIGRSAWQLDELFARGPLVPRLRNSVRGDGITAGLE